MTGTCRRLVYNGFHQDLTQPLVRADGLTLMMGAKLPSNTLPGNVVGMLNKSGNKVVCHANDVIDDNHVGGGGGGGDGESDKAAHSALLLAKERIEKAAAGAKHAHQALATARDKLGSNIASAAQLANQAGDSGRRRSGGGGDCVIDVCGDDDAVGGGGGGGGDVVIDVGGDDVAVGGHVVIDVASDDSHPLTKRCVGDVGEPGHAGHAGDAAGIDGSPGKRVCLQGISAVGAMYCDNATIVGAPCDGVISVMFGNSSANSAAGTGVNNSVSTDAGVDSPDANNGGSDVGVCSQQVSDRTVRIERLPRMTVVRYGYR